MSFVQFLHTGTLENLNILIYNAELTLKTARPYFLKNGLKLNANKTQCIFLGMRKIIPKIPDNTTLKFHDTTIKPSSSVKNLGVHFDNYLTFETHVNEMSKKVMGTLMYINRIKHCFDKPTRILAVQSLVLSVLNYCITIWANTNTTLLTTAQKLQNFAIKVADGKAQKFDHVTPIFQELEWLNMKKVFIFNTAVTVFKQLHNHYLQTIVSLPTVTDITGSRTRQQYHLYVSRANTQSGGRSLSVRGPALWNQLPQDVKGANSVQSFKTLLKQYLMINDT